MEDLLQNWGAALAYFAVVGLVFEALKRTIGAKAGDKGLKGVWYVWKRVFLLPLGATLGAAGGLIEVPTIFGADVGGGALSGLIGAAGAVLFFNLVVGTARSRLKHKLANGG